MNKRIGIISDTHGLLRPEVVEILETCDYVTHGGDIDNEDTLEELRALKPLTIVKGNNDWGPWADDLDEMVTVEIEGVCFLIVHDKKQVPKELDHVDVVVFGHSHKYYEHTEDGVLWLNPGGCGRSRFRLPVTMAVIEMGQGQIQVEKIIICR